MHSMRTLNATASDFDRQLGELLDRATPEADVDQVVERIIDDVRQQGDEAVVRLTRELDRVEADSMAELELDPVRVSQLVARVPDDLQSALRAAADRIRAFHEHEVQSSWQYTEADGTVLGQKVTPLDRVGVYVPGGKAAYPSSVLMTAIPARVAGVREIIMTVPTPGGEVDPAVIAAASIAGVDRILTIGGAQAVAALAYGTQTVPRVDKIVGPGNIYVATAKQKVFGRVGIDIIAGPSEVVVICDDSANPEWVAMDLFAQAEHDELAQAIAITDSAAMAEAIRQAVERLLPDMPRRAIIEQSLTRSGAIIQVGDLEQAATVSNRIAPEHLELMVEDVDSLLERIIHAGAIFAGRHSAEALGDYCAGPNHVLPTAGTARFSSPLGVYDFQKRSSLIRASAAGADAMAQVAEVLATSEGLSAHARSAGLRKLSPQDEP